MARGDHRRCGASPGSYAAAAMIPADADIESFLDESEELPAGMVWWTRHTRLGVLHVLDLPPTDGDLPALELQLLGERDGESHWAWRTDRGAVLARVIAAKA